MLCISMVYDEHYIYTIYICIWSSKHNINKDYYYYFIFFFRLPGTKKGDLSARASKPQVMVTGLEFSPTGREFAAATTEGLLMYSLDSKMIFDPFELEEEITPKATRLMLREQEYDRALSMALKLNEPDLIREVIEQIPPHQVLFILFNVYN